MSFDDLRHKADYVLKYLPASYVREMELGFKSVMAPMNLNCILKEQLFLDSVYAWTRYFHWSDLDLFRHFYLHFLTETYPLTEVQRLEMLSFFKQKFQAIESGNFHKRLSTLSDFLRILILHALKQDPMHRDFETQTTFLIQQSAQNDIEHEHGYVTTTRRVLKELKDAMEATPWILDFYKLDYRFLRVDPLLSGEFQRQKPFWLWEFLYELCLKGQMKKTAVSVAWPSVASSDPSQALWWELKHKGLVYELGAEVKPSHEAFKLTAAYFVSLHTDASFQQHEFLSWHPYWQLELSKVRRHAAMFFEILSDNKPLHGHVLMQIVQTLKGSVAEAELKEVLLGYLKDGLTKDLRIAAGFCLKEYWQDSQVQKELLAFLKKHSSDIVQNHFLESIQIQSKYHVAGDVQVHFEALPRRLCEFILS